MTHVHFVGIGGAGLSAIAQVLLESGYTVSGSDEASSPFAGAGQRGRTVYQGHAAEQVNGAEMVIISSAVPADNVEVLAAQARGIPVLKRADFLGRLMEDRMGIAVAGTHGKTTTTGLVAFMLDRAGLDPTFVVGGLLADYGTNARAGKGRPFVIEADEYDRMFLGLKPTVAVVLNVEHDHPDCYPTLKEMQEAFRAFVESAAARRPAGGLRRRTPSPTSWSTSAARPAGRRCCTAASATTITGPTRSSSTGRGATTFWWSRTARRSAWRATACPGEHNVLNSLAALAVADFVGVEFNDARNALADYRGAGRRFEVKGEARGVTVVDDYAHHPTEIRATLAAARRRFGDRPLWVMFQPHTFSRTRTLLAEFAASFADADHVIIVDIFRSREALDPA